MSTTTPISPVKVFQDVPVRYAMIAACMAHVEGYYSINSLSFKNNNPGNIESPNGRFYIYQTKITGFNALIRDIIANKGKTLRAFIAKYAPPNENNDSMYLQVVSTLSGVGEDEIL